MTSDSSVRIKPLLKRKADSHKYDFGHVLVIGGSPGMIGAPLLAARAALRSGAGVVTIAAPDNVIDKLEKRVTEIMTLRLPAESTVAATRTLNEFIKKRHVSVLAIGPGLAESQKALVKSVMKKWQLPMVLDAGGLVAYQRNLTALARVARKNPQIIITPHQGEFGRLVGTTLPATIGQLRHKVLDTAKVSGLTIVLKGNRTFVAEPGGRSYTNRSGNPGLATAGTGDVLTGIIAALLGQGLVSFEAAQAGVYLHGLAGDLAAAAKTQPGMTASDVLDCIPRALKSLS